MDPLTLMMVAVLALMVVFMFRNSRKQKADREALQSKIVKGANVMTQSGIFGTIQSIDAETNEVLLETTPKVVLRVHRQSIANVVGDAAPAASAATTKSAAAPAKKAPAKKPSSRTAK